MRARAAIVVVVAPKKGPMIMMTAAVAALYFSRKSDVTPAANCADSTLRVWLTSAANAARTPVASRSMPRSSASGSTVPRTVSCTQWLRCACMSRTYAATPTIRAPPQQ